MDEPINILIVDDEPKNLTVLETVLADPGYRLVRAGSADEALLALVEGEFALLILDVRMPGMTGFELAQMVKERKKTAGIPIIFLTAYYNEDQHVLEGYHSGAVDYLNKPVNPVVLRSKVAVFAQLYRANRALAAEVEERRRAEEELRELNESLERRVLERTEALGEQDRRRTEFLAILAHELRNPLAPIRNALQILQLSAGRGRSPDVETVLSASRMMERQMAQMVRLVDDLLDVSRVSRGKIELRPVRVELASVVHQAVESVRPLYETKGHQLTVTLASPVYLSADPVRLVQVLGNLLNNACKFTDKGGSISLSVECGTGSTEPKTEDRDAGSARRSEICAGSSAFVEIRVRDNGIGIAVEEQPRIFDMFVQIDTSLERTASGLGIGLTLVKNLVELHGGTVEVHSDGPNRGSEFVVRLPVLAEQPRAAEPNAAGPAGAAGRRILVVDDNRDSAESLADLLQLTGHQTHTCYDGLAAVEAAAAFRPDVALLDIGLPKLNGYEAARRIREQPGGQGMILVALTGWGQEEDRQMAHDAGFDGHMIKPVDFAALMKLLAGLTAAPA